MSNLSREIARRLRAPKNKPFHLSPGAQPMGTTVELTVENATSQPHALLTDTRRAHTWSAYLTDQGGGTYKTTIRLPDEMTIITYQFAFADEDTPHLLERRQQEGHTTPIYGEWIDMPFKIAVYDPDRMPADWTQGLLIYQIFPDRFADGDPSNNRVSEGVYGHEPLYKAWGERPEHPPMGRDFFGGDLRGIVDKLDYLADLGIECIYLNPIFKAPSNHRYEATDYLQIDPMLGDDALFDELIEGAHARDIKIILDGVFNHCSSDSVYFDIQRQYGGACASKESPYFRWFEFEEYPTKYKGWYGFGFMPEFVECPEVEHFFNGEDGVTAYWLKRGIDGWRLDVAFDNTDHFWRGFRRRVEATKPGAYTISEEWRDSTHYLLGDTFNATMNYRFSHAVRGFFADDNLSAGEFDDRMMTWLRDTPAPAVKAQMNLVDSHDTIRMMDMCIGDTAEKHQRIKQIAAFMLSYPGAPTIYYGSETALEGNSQEDGRRCMPWDNLDADMGAYYRKIIHQRRYLPALKLGDVETVIADDQRRVYAFTRSHGEQTVLCIFNVGSQAAEVKLPVTAGSVNDVLNEHPIKDGVITLPPHGSAWVV